MSAGNKSEPRYAVDTELEASTNRVMLIGAGLMFALVLLFPLYRLTEPANREEARAAQLDDLAAAGESTWSFDCSSCHGLNGEGAIGPALNSKQFLESANNTQIQNIVSVGVPGTQMSAYSLDYGGPLTSEQIKAVVTYIRSWEETAPDRPDWRDMLNAEPGAAADTATDTAGG